MQNTATELPQAAADVNPCALSAIPGDATKSLVTVTRLTAEKPNRLTKRFELVNNGGLKKLPGGALTQGLAESIEVDFPDGFATELESLSTNQALIYGTPSTSPVTIIPKQQWQDRNCPAGFLPRTKEHFSWPAGPGILMLDFDPRPGGEAHDRDSLLELLESLSPAFASAASVYWVSSSSHIFNDSQRLSGLKGQRMYFQVADASDIERAGQVLVDRLWLAGHGYIEISRSGRLLERCTFDASVWQPSRIDFAAGAECKPPLVQRRGQPVVAFGGALDTLDTLPDLSQEDQAQVNALKEQAKSALRNEQQQVQLEYVEQRCTEIATDKTEQALESARETIKRALEQRILYGDFPLTLDDGAEITVAEALDDPKRYHNRQTRDPLEPEYQNHKTVGRLYLIGSRQNLHSFAHGGNNYRLVRQPRRILYERGKQFEAREQSLEVMRTEDDLYDLGEQLVVVSDGRSIAMDRSKMQRRLGATVRYYRYVERNGEQFEFPVDVSTQDAVYFLELGATRRLKPLDAVISAPIILPDGRVIDRPGYDEASRLYLDTTQNIVPIPDNPSDADIRQALTDVMEPFAQFPFASPLDRTVMLASILTACVRPAIPTAPAFGFDAPTQGSGKTLLAKTIGVLATGMKPTVHPHVANGNDDELRKRFLSILREGSRVVIIDNILGFFDSAAFAALLTSETLTDRVLGASQQLTLPNRSLFMLTGNNLTMAGDMPRRVLKCRIDPRMEHPHSRAFGFDPETFVMQHRQRLVSAAITLIRGWFASGDYMMSNTAPGRLASFEIWDDMVRQPIAWLSRHFDSELEDPMRVIDQANANDPQQESLSELLKGIQEQFGTRPFYAKELHRAAELDFDLSDTLCDMAGGNLPSKKSLGRYLTNREDRVVDGLVLRQAGARQNTKRWCISRVDAFEIAF